MPRLSALPKFTQVAVSRGSHTSASSGVVQRESTGSSFQDSSFHAAIFPHHPWEVQDAELLRELRLPILRFGDPLDRFFLFVMYGIAVVDICWVPFLCSFARFEHIWDFIVGSPIALADEIMNVIYVLGALKELRTSAVDLIAGREYVNPRDIAWYRVNSPLFWADLVSTVGGLWYILDCRELCAFRIIRAWRISNASDDMYELHLAKLSGGPLASLLELLISIVIIIHVMSCTLFFAMIRDWPDWREGFEKDPRFWGGGADNMYVYCFAQGAAMLTGWSSPSPASEDRIFFKSEYLCWCIVAPCAAIFNAFIFTSLMDVFHQATSATSVYLDGMRAAALVMNSLMVPESLKDKVLRYLSYLSVQKVNAIQDNLLRSLSTDLLLEVKLHVFHTLVRSPIFREAPPRLLTDMVMSFDQLVCNPGSILFYKGDISSELYFIIKGTAEVLIDDCTVVAHKRAGDYFGEMALTVTEHERNATVRAKTFCVFAKLTRETFVDIVNRESPEVRERLASAVVGGPTSDPDSEKTPLLSEREFTDVSIPAAPHSDAPSKRLSTAQIVKESLRQTCVAPGKLFGSMQTLPPDKAPLDFGGFGGGEESMSMGGFLRVSGFEKAMAPFSAGDESMAMDGESFRPVRSESSSSIKKAKEVALGQAMSKFDSRFGNLENKLGKMESLILGVDARVARIEAAVCGGYHGDGLGRGDNSNGVGIGNVSFSLPNQSKRMSDYADTIIV